MSGIAIVTGGSRGIGAATARMLAERGHDVAISYLSNAEAAAAVVRDIEAAGRRGLAVKCDAGGEQETERLFETVDKELGTLTALVNNAGITGKVDRLDSAPAETIRACIDANLYGTIWACRAAVRRMSTRFGGKGGAIVNVSSIASKLGSPNYYVWYAAAKGGVDALTIGLAKEVVKEGIRVNAVAPGIIDTDIHESSSGLPGRVEKEAHLIPMGRAGT
ncbi:MAG: SDR family NAD(P)-dependent oxidoreductase, partial [Alphaproteobacteria bacterium]|nr:SDR family NAD(P)-dependent oxidoreductase [Alphaproteobacteria bacterium]